MLDVEAPAWRARYLGQLPARLQGAAIFTDKHPLNFWSVGLIRALFPDARIVHAARDVRDTALSIFTQRFYGQYRFANDLDADSLQRGLA